MNKSKTLVTSITFTLLSVLLLSKPVLLIFGHEKGVAGIPSLYIYIFVVWLIIAVGSYLIFGRQSDSEAK